MTPEATKPQYPDSQFGVLIMRSPEGSGGGLTVWIDEEGLAGWLNTDISKCQFTLAGPASIRMAGLPPSELPPVYLLQRFGTI